MWYTSAKHANKYTKLYKRMWARTEQSVPDLWIAGLTSIVTIVAVSLPSSCSKFRDICYSHLESSSPHLDVLNQPRNIEAYAILPVESLFNGSAVRACVNGSVAGLTSSPRSQRPWLAHGTPGRRLSVRLLLSSPVQGQTNGRRHVIPLHTHDHRQPGRERLCSALP